MRVLTDTHTLVWALESPELLSAGARFAMDQSHVIASVANFWELCLKSGKKRALVVDPVDWWNKYVVAAGIPTLPIRTSDVIALNSLPDIHKDPFDRILIAQSKTEGIPLVTKDSHIARYDIPVIW